MTSQWMSQQRGYVLAAGGTALATGLRWVLDPWLGNTSPYIIFYLSIALAAYVGGLGPGLAALLLGAVVGKLLFISERGSFRIHEPEDVALLIFFLLSSALMVLLVSWGHGARRKLHESERRFRGTFENAAVGITHIDPEGRWLRINHKLCEMLGYSEEELRGRRFADIAHPDDREPDLSRYGPLMRGELDSYAVEKRYIRKDGRFLWVRATRSAQRDESGRAVYSISVIEDISAGKQAEEAVAESRRRLAGIIDSAMDAIITIDDEQRIVLFNPAAEQMFRCPAEGALGSSIDHFIPERFRAVHREHVREFARTGNTARTMSHLRPLAALRADGEEFPIEASISQVEVDGRKLFSVILRDITERKRVETALRESEEKFRMIAENARAAFGIVRGERFVYANPYFAQLSGYSVEEILSMDFPQMVHPDFRPLLIERARRRQRGEPVPANYEFMMLTRSGETRWVDFSAAKIEYQGQPAIIGAGFDITERKRAEAALRASEAQVRLQAAALESAASAIALSKTDADGTIIWVNRAFTDLTGYSAQEAIGQSHRILKSGEQDEAFYRELWATVARGEVWRGELINRRKDGTLYHEEMNITPLRDEAGRITHYVAIKQDITARKRATEELAAARRAAEQASRAKDHFLAVLSHELRTPLTPVQAIAELLATDPRLEHDLRQDLEVIRRNVELEARLIDDLLDLTRIARGKIELVKRPVPLCEVISRAVEICHPDIEARQLHFSVDLGESAPYLIEADPARLQQVFWNLLKNSVKFTPPGGSVGVRCRQLNGHVVAEVSDTGLGIEPEAMGRIFNAFEQAGASITRQFGGLGLGLAISKALVEMHGGMIEARSEGRGKGATFRVSLPLGHPAVTPDRAPAKPAPVHAEQSSRPLRVLLVEDHGDTARIMARLLARRGHKVRTAGDVATALELVSRERFDLLISDLGLPDRSGVELIRELRAKGHLLPAIALSGYGQEEDLNRSREAGFNAHLIKPVDSGQLYRTISSVCG